MWDVLGKIVEAILKPVMGWFGKRADDGPREAILRERLADRPPDRPWMTIETLAAQIGADEKETTRLLIRIGARRSTGQRAVWRLPDANDD